MANIKSITRPASQRDDYRFFENLDTSKTFKVLHQIGESINGDPTITITVTQTDTDGHAIPEPDGVVKPHQITHIFTPYELTSENFDAEAALARVIDRAVVEKEREIAAKDAIQALSNKWKTKTVLNMDKKTIDTNPPK